MNKVFFKFHKLTYQNKFQRYHFSHHTNLNPIQSQKTVYLERYENNYIVHLCLNSTSNRNALSKQLINDLTDSILELQNDKNIRVLIIKSNIEKIFCAGADLKERLNMTHTEVTMHT